jgi:glycosyltransferase involved in cell wall biosynthesis
MKISIVIPVYKSSESLKIIAAQVYELGIKLKEYNFELIFVNDSPAFYDTSQALEVIGENYEFTRVVTLRKNQGQHMALLVGISVAKGDYIITMDDDLQNPVCEIPKLVNALLENEQTEVVFAVPAYSQKKHNLWRNFGSYILNKLDTFFLQKPKGLIKSPFRIFGADISNVILNNYNATPALSSLLINTTSKIINIEVEHKERAYGSSNYTLTKLIRHTFNNILHYSSLPLKLVGIIGLFGFLFSLVFILIVIIRKIFNGIEMSGYASTVSLVSFFGGLNLLSLGLVGEYLIRIIKEQQKVKLDDLISKIN